MTITKLTPADAGCLVSDTRGWRSVLHVIRLANRLGMPLNATDNEAMEFYDENRPLVRVIDERGYSIEASEWVMWLTEKTEQWLDDNAAPDGYHFHWHDGSFYLSSNTETDDI